MASHSNTTDGNLHVQAFAHCSYCSPDSDIHLRTQWMQRHKRDGCIRATCSNKTSSFDGALRQCYRYILCKHDGAIKIDLNDSVGSSNHANGVSIALDGEGKDTTATVGFQQRPSNVAAVIVVFSRGSDADNEILDSSEVSAWNPEMGQSLTIKADDFKLFGLRNVSIELCPSAP